MPRAIWSRKGGADRARAAPTPRALTRSAPVPLHLFKMAVGIGDRRGAAPRAGRARCRARRRAGSTPATIRAAPPRCSTAARSIGSSAARSRCASGSPGFAASATRTAARYCLIEIDPGLVATEPRTVPPVSGLALSAAGGAPPDRRSGRRRAGPRAHAGRVAGARADLTPMKLLSRVPLDNRRRGSYFGFRADPRADIQVCRP